SLGVRRRASGRGGGLGLDPSVEVGLPDDEAAAHAEERGTLILVAHPAEGVLAERGDLGGFGERHEAVAGARVPAGLVAGLRAGSPLGLTLDGVGSLHLTAPCFSEYRAVGWPLPRVPAAKHRTRGGGHRHFRGFPASRFRSSGSPPRPTLAIGNRGRQPLERLTSSPVDRQSESLAGLVDDGDRTAEDFLGMSIRLAREELDMSQEDLALRMGDYGFSWSKTTVWKTETARRPIRVNEAAAIGEVLGVHVAKLIGDARDNWAEHAQLLRLLARVNWVERRIREAETEVAELSEEYRRVATELERLQFERAARRGRRGKGKET